jgi:hypothetical protein
MGKYGVIVDEFGLAVFAMWNNGIMLYTRQFTTGNISGYLFQIFLICRKKQTPGVFCLRCAQLVILVVVLDVVLFDKLIRSHNE